MQPLTGRIGLWNALSHWCTLRRWLPLAAVAAYGSDAGIHALRAQEPAKPMVAAAPAEKKYKVSFNDTPWPQVMDWFATESKLTYLDTVKPPRTLTIKSDREYTIAQVLDLLNEALAQQKMIIIRRSQTFLVHPADERLPPELVSMITIDELPTRGDTEVVQVILPLTTVVAEDIAPQMKKLLSSFGTASAFGANQIIILDKAKNIRNIQHYIASLEKDITDQFNHQCKYVRASAAAEQLRQLLVDEKTVTASSTAQLPNTTSPWGAYGGWGAPPAAPTSSRDSRATQERRFRSVQISVDNPSNTVRLTGPADKVVAARELIKNIDKGDTPRAIGGKEFWKTYNVTPGTAEARAKAVMSIPEFKGSGIQLLTVGTSQVEVYGLPADHLDLENYFKMAPDSKPNVATELINLNGGDPTRMAATLSKILGGKGLVAEARTEGANAVWMRGAPEDIEEAKRIIKSDPDGGQFGPVSDKIKIIPIDKANAGVLAEEIGRMMNQMGYPTRVNGIGGEKKPEATKPMTIPTPGSPMSAAPTATNIRQVSAQLVDPQKEDKPAVGISVVGDKIVITGEDPRAVQLAYELLNVYLKSGSATTGLEQYTILKLKSASATEAAAVINEVFNGPPQQGGGSGGGGRGQSGGGGGSANPLASLNPLNFLSQFTGGSSAPANPSAGRVRVVAEKNSNSLIVVKASQLDMLTIKDLLKKAIDDDSPPEGGVARTHMIQLQYAKASELAPLVRNVYATSTGRSQRGPAQTQQPAFPFGQPQQSQQPSNVSLTVEYEDNTNKLIVNCVDSLFIEINKLVTELDKAAKDSAEVVDFISLKPGGMTATQIAQAIDALAGRPPTQANNRGGFGQQGGFGGNQGGFGQGGFGGGFGQQGGLGQGSFGQQGGFGQGGLGTPFGGGFNRPVGGGGLGGGLGSGGFGGTGTGGGGTRGGGGGTRGGGGGMRPGGNRQAMLDGGGGRDFFEDRDMDVPSAFSVLFDPELESPEVTTNNDRSALYALLAEKVRRSYEGAPAQQVKFQQPEPEPQNPEKMPPPAPMPPKPLELGATFTSPSTDVQIIPLEFANGLVIRGKTKAEVEAIKAIIAALQATAQKTAEINIRIVPLKFGDATSLVSELTQIFSRLQFGTGTTTFPIGNQQFGGVGFGGQGGQGQQQGSLLLFAVPRLNSILLAVPKSREEDIIKEIEKLDRLNDKQMKPVAYPLSRASAQNVATQLQSFFNQRYPNEQLQQNQIRITYDILNNTVYVQASVADQADIADLIKMWDSSKSKTLSDVRVFRLRNAFSDDLSQTLIQTLLANVVNPQSANTAGGLPTTGAGGLGGAAAPGLGATGGLAGATGGTALGGTQNRAGGAGGFGTLTGSNTGLTTKFVGLRYKSTAGSFESGLLEDVHIVSDARINALIVTAPDKTMKLLEALINELDGVAAAKAFVNVFPLKKADAQVVQQLIINLFSGVSRTGAGATGGIGGGIGGTQTTQGTTRPLLTLTNNPSDGASLIDLRLTADPRTNTLIVAGSQNDIDLIRAVIGRLEDSEAPQYTTEVYKLRNAAAADVVTAVQAFLVSSANIENAQFTTTTTYQTLQRQFAMQAEPVSNTILVSATPQLFGKIMQLIERVDASPPQVFVQVLIADVQLTNNHEFGVEIGLQSDVLFARGQVAGGGTAPGTPGFLFNTTSPLGNTNVASPNQVGFSGLGNLGVGRTGSSGVGGLVFAASNNTFNLLVRALSAQGRLDVLSRPELLLTDNQTGFFQVGQLFPLPGQTTVTGTGLAQTSITYQSIGIVMRITPRISPDGRVLMRIEPSISSPGTPVIVNGAAQPVIDNIAVETTVLANDGETIVLGGLIRKSDQKNENKIPVLGDLPYVGAAFRYRTQSQTRRELIFIMTPHIIRSEADMQRIVAEEARKMSWSLKDVDCIHGHGMELLSGRGTSPQDCPPIPWNPQGTVPTPGTGPDGQPIIVKPALDTKSVPEAKTPNPLFSPPSGMQKALPGPEPFPTALPNVPVPTKINTTGWNSLPAVQQTSPSPAPAKEGQAPWAYSR